MMEGVQDRASLFCIFAAGRVCLPPVLLDSDLPYTRRDKTL